MPSPAAPTLSVLYLLDPLCGWCYGASPKIARLERAGVEVNLLPTGLFSGEGAKQMSPGLARYAWQNDQRIHSLTGQVFSEAYRTHVLEAEGTPFDSQPLTLGLLAVRQTTPDRELAALRCLQEARYVHGKPTTTLAAVEAILTESGFGHAVDLLRDHLPALLAKAQEVIGYGQQMMSYLGARGVPTFAITQNNRPRVVELDDLLAQAGA